MSPSCDNGLLSTEQKLLSAGHDCDVSYVSESSSYYHIIDSVLSLDLSGAEVTWPTQCALCTVSKINKSSMEPQYKTHMTEVHEEQSYFIPARRVNYFVL